MIEIASLAECTAYLKDIELVVLDMDDTLYSEKEYVYSGYGAAARLLPHIDNAQEELWSAFLNGEPAFDSVLRKKGVWSEELMQACLHAYRFHTPDIHLYPDAQELLCTLAKQGYKLGLITDGRPEGQRAKIAALGLERWMQYMIVTDELGGVQFRKPNPTAFCMMQERFGIPFSHMCYIGDNPQKDFIAPQQLGMRSIYFRNSDGLYYR